MKSDSQKNSNLPVRNSILCAISLACALGIGVGGTLHAAPFTWDNNSTSAGIQDGLGNWTTATTTSNFITTGGANAAWTNGGDAFFGNGSSTVATTGGAVTLTSAITANSITFNPIKTGAYTLTWSKHTYDYQWLR